MKQIVVNGANGYVASHFICEMLNRGHRVIALARENEKQSARERVEQAILDTGQGEIQNGHNLRVFGYSLLAENFSIPVGDLEAMFRPDADFFHFAASLKFDFNSESEILRTNVAGVENSIEVFQKYATENSRFFLIGTAYSCGNFRGVFEEKFYPDEVSSAFRNYYEYSKRLAENLVKRKMEAYGIRAHIIRLAQVVGDNETGVTTTDYGVFDFAKRLSAISRRYPDESVRIKVDPTGTQTLIAINTVVNYLRQSVDANELPIIMNFVPGRSIQNIHIINTLNDLLALTIIPKIELNPEDLTGLEKLVSAAMAFTGEYTTINLNFDTSQRDKVIVPEEHGIDEETIAHMLNYFVTHVCKANVSREKTVPVRN